MTSRDVIISIFVIALAMFATVELLARREESRIPTLGELGGFVMTYKVGRLPLGRIAVLGFWWWLGWHFFAR